jgi:hypothetical protein
MLYGHPLHTQIASAAPVWGTKVTGRCKKSEQRAKNLLPCLRHPCTSLLLLFCKVDILALPEGTMAIPHIQSGLDTRESFALKLRWAGWVGFVVELALTVMGLLILLVAIFDPSFNINVKSGFSLFAFFASFIALGLGIFWMFRYIKLSRVLLSETESYPKPNEIRQTLHRGINIHFVGILLSLLATQIIVGSLMFKVMTLPSGGVIYQNRQMLEPLDVFVVQASVFMIAAACIGLLIHLGLLKFLNARSH